MRQNNDSRCTSNSSPSAPCLTVELKPLCELKPDPGNPRLHTEKHVGQLVKSIAAFGFCVPILLDRQSHVIAGHGRLLAAERLGWSVVPTITLDHLSADQVRALRIADNRLSECSSWNERLLAEQLQLLAAADLDFDLEAIGFDLPEIDLRIQSLGDLDEEEGSAEDPLDGVPVVSIHGDIWQLGKHRIACGSALETSTYESLFGSSKADLVISDMPFNLSIKRDISHNGRVKHEEFVQASGEMSAAEFTAFLSQACTEMKRASRNGALLYLFMDSKHMTEILAAGVSSQLEFKSLVVWAKNVGGMGSFYRSAHELIFVYKSGTAKHVNNIQLGVHGRNRTNVWNYAGVPSASGNTGEGNLRELHPTVKPVALIADAILDASERGDIVLDPFLGSGTAVVAAEKTGRIGYGIELDPRYVDTAVRRWQRLTSLQAVHAVSGQSFDDVAQERGQHGDSSGSERTHPEVGERHGQG